MTHPAKDKAFDALKPADFRFLVERNGDGILVLDEAGMVQFANPAAEHLFGRSANDLVGMPLGIPLIAGEATEISISRPGTSQIEAELCAIETMWKRHPALLVNVRDISQRKLAEERLRHAQKMEAIGRLTAGLSHDFNNLLMIILGNLGVIEQESAALDVTPRLRNAILHGREGAQRAAVLTRQLLDFARPKPLADHNIEINEILSKMTLTLKSIVGENVKLTSKLCDRQLIVKADLAEFESTVLNLALNAKDAMPRGGQLDFKTKAIHNDGRHLPLPTGGYAEICVSDDGIGMSKETAARAFEPFFTTKEMGQGTGLGLSQVFGFVRQSGGHAVIESTPGQGTSVFLYLPLCIANQDLSA
ncbi:MAG TPA: ATP-binding protein [Rhizomicrobium sp.]|nr:ATP-binding protein [Rhizomicrobium sp.]